MSKLNPYYFNTLLLAASVGYLAGDIRGMVMGIAFITGMTCVLAWFDR